MTRRLTLALLLSLLVLTSRTAAAGQRGGAAPGQNSVADAAATVSGSLLAATGGTDSPVLRSPNRNDALCLTCHDDAALETHLADGTALSLHVDASGLRDSAHGQLGCLSCHVDHVTHPEQATPSAGLADYQARAVKMCVSCHLAAADGYADSVHGAPVLSGTGLGATCNDCHSPDGSAHATSRVADLETNGAPASGAATCGRCHIDELASYRRTGHGQLVEFADNRRAATCADCHGAHDVKAVNDPSSGLAPAGLTGVCQKCHQGADQQFAGQWRGHEASISPSGLADYAHRGVILLMAVGVCFGVAHVTLDFLRDPRHTGGSPK